MRALAVLSISSPVTINELSQFALTEQSTMSRTLDALEEQGFIVRKPRPRTCACATSSITEAGRDAFAKVWPTMYDLLLKMFEGDRQRGIQSLHRDDAQDDAEHPQARDLIAAPRCAGPP